MALAAERRPGGGSTFPLLAAVLLAVGCVLATQYGYALRVPFINDDYVFLDKTRSASFGSLWTTRQLAFHWYRPWSRELHYWTLQRVFGLGEAPWHAVSLALILVLALVYAALVRRLAGGRTAAIATAGLFAMAAWSVPAVWVAGVQDVWMLLFGVLALLALEHRRSGLAVLAGALALLSKETAAVLPAIAIVFVGLRRGQGARAALRETAGLWSVLILWAAVHPLLGGRLWHPVAMVPDPGLHPSSWLVAARTLLGLLNLDAVPRPIAGWGLTLARASPAAVALAALVLLAMRRPARAANPPHFRAAAFGGAWALLAWLPLFAPSIGWHAYYALFGACGAWLALGALLTRRPAFAVALVVALALVRTARATTPSRDWGSEFYQVRSASFLDAMRTDLLRLHPSVPPHSRMFFALIPSHVGFLAGDAPVLRVWYRDSTLSGGRFTQFVPRRPGSAGEDYFFRYVAPRGWVEIPSARGAVLDPGDAGAVADASALAGLFAQANEWARAADQYERLATALPASGEFALEAGVTRAMAGDRHAAAAWFRRALAAPAATDSTRGAARAMLAELDTMPAGGAAPKSR